VFGVLSGALIPYGNDTDTDTRSRKRLGQFISLVFDDRSVRRYQELSI